MLFKHEIRQLYRLLVGRRKCVSIKFSAIETHYQQYRVYLSDSAYVLASLIIREAYSGPVAHHAHSNIIFLLDFSKTLILPLVLSAKATYFMLMSKTFRGEQYLSYITFYCRSVYGFQRLLFSTL